MSNLIYVLDTKCNLLVIFFIGGIILIYLSNLDFLGFKGKIGPLSTVLIGLFIFC